MKHKKVKLAAYIITGAVSLTSCVKDCVASLPSTNATLSDNNNNVSLSDRIEVELDKKYEDRLSEINVPTDTLSNPTEPTKFYEEETLPIIENVVKEKDNNTIVYATANLYIRSSNDENSLEIGMINIYESAYKILSCDNGWDLIRYNGVTGYVKSDYLDYSTECLPEETYNHTEKKDIVVTTSNLNLRELPTSESKRLYTFEENTELEVLAEVDNGWLLVRYNGELGYVHSGYVISMLEMAQAIYPELSLEELEVKKIVYPTSSLNMRTGSGIEYDSLGLLEKYETVRVLEEYEDWYFVLNNERTFSFVNKNYVIDIPDKCIVVDKSSQQLYFYENHKLLYTTPVTTGKDESPSDTGKFEILTKAMYVTLTDNLTYWSDVIYWLRYNGGEGIHDASWRKMFNESGATYRNTFGSEGYHYYGSHGCINTPHDVVKKIYQRVEVGDNVLVHK